MNKKKEFERVYTEYYKKAFYICWSIIKDYDESKDAVSELFISIYRNFENIKDMKSYINMAARNQALNRVTRRRNDLEFNEEISFSPLSVENDNIRREKLEKVERALSSLTQKEREVFCRKFYLGLDYFEIAQELEITESTCRVVLKNALSKLKEAVNV